MNELIAWQGTVEILNATWSLDSGRTVELRLCGDSYDRVHPFKRFQKRRNGRVGTRFQAAFSRVDDGAEVLAMEVMLAAWKDSSSIGQSITLWLDNEVAVHPFCGCQRRKAAIGGDMFALALVELNDDDTPINQTHEQKFETRAQSKLAVDPASTAPGGEGHRTTRTTGVRRELDPKQPSRARGAPKKLSSTVHLLVTSQIFLRWLQETKGTLVKEWTPELARRYAKSILKVESLGDLDRDAEAVKRYHENIRRPYERWRFQEP